MLIRRYRNEDAAATLAVFRRAVHETAAADYSPEQREAWAPEDVDLEAWAARRSAATTYVAVDGDQVIGFADLIEDHIDMTYVDPAAGRRGIAGALIAAVTREARGHRLSRLTVHASLTARPFFEQQGFTVEEERTVVRARVRLTNVAMSRRLESSSQQDPDALQLPP